MGAGGGGGGLWVRHSAANGRMQAPMWRCGAAEKEAAGPKHGRADGRRGGRGPPRTPVPRRGAHEQRLHGRFPGVAAARRMAWGRQASTAAASGRAALRCSFGRGQRRRTWCVRAAAPAHGLRRSSAGAAPVPARCAASAPSAGSIRAAARLVQSTLNLSTARLRSVSARLWEGGLDGKCVVQGKEQIVALLAYARKRHLQKRSQVSGTFRG
jgi:hypothetical protein